MAGKQTKEEILKIGFWIVIFILSIILFIYLLTNYQFNKKMEHIDELDIYAQDSFNHYYESLELGYFSESTLDYIEETLYRIEEIREEIKELDKRPFWKLDGANKLLFDMDESTLEFDRKVLEYQRIFGSLKVQFPELSNFEIQEMIR